jgi:hypothetical protein
VAVGAPRTRLQHRAWRRAHGPEHTPPARKVTAIGAHPPTRKAATLGSRTSGDGGGCTRNSHRRPSRSQRPELASPAMEATMPGSRSALHGCCSPNLRVAILAQALGLLCVGVLAGPPCRGAHIAAHRRADADAKLASPRVFLLQVAVGLPPDRSCDVGWVWRAVSRGSSRPEESEAKPKHEGGGAGEGYPSWPALMQRSGGGVWDSQRLCGRVVRRWWPTWGRRRRGSSCRAGVVAMWAVVIREEARRRDMQ